MAARELVTLPPGVKCLPHSFGFFEDFWNCNPVDASDNAYTGPFALVGDTGSVATNGTAAGGVLSCLTDATDNDYSAGIMVNSPFYAGGTNGPIVFGARIKLTETDTTNYDASALIGLAEIKMSAADLITDVPAIGAIAAVGSAVAIYKLAAQDEWNLISGNNDDHTAFTVTRLQLAVSSGSWLTVELSFEPTQGGDYDVSVRADTSGGQNLIPIYESADTRSAPLGRQVPVKHSHSAWTASLLVPQLIVKNTESQAEKLETDYVYCYQAR